MQQEAQDYTTDDILIDILYSLQSQRFEPGGVFTIGGGTPLKAIVLLLALLPILLPTRILQHHQLQDQV